MDKNPQPDQLVDRSDTQTHALTRREVAATLMGVFGLSTLSGCQPDAQGEYSLGAAAQAISSTGTNVQWCDTYSELRTLVGGTTSTSKNVAVCRGSSGGAPYVGGGGLFAWSGDMTTADNGGTIIAASSGRTGCWKRLYDGAVNVRWFGAAGDGVTSDNIAIDNAVATVQALPNGILFFPPSRPSQFYKTTAPIVVTGPIKIIGSGPNATTILGVGLTRGQYVLDFNCIPENIVEQIEISGLTLRSDNSVPCGLHLNNTSYVRVEDVRAYALNKGIVIEGTRCFSQFYKNVTGYAITSQTVEFASGFTGGGQFIFDGCTFCGDIGFYVPSTATLDNLAFTACNWEQCVSDGLWIRGTVSGVSIVGCRTEGGDGVDFNFRPFAPGEYVAGIAIHGCVFSASDAGAVSRIYMGGDSGTIRGFSISGNVVTHSTNSFSGTLVLLNGDGESGVITGNYLRGSTATVVNTYRSGVRVYSNENMTGKLPEASGAYVGSATYDPPSLVHGAGATTTISAPGAAAGDFAIASFSNDLQGVTLTAWVSTANTVSVRFQNHSGATLNLASGTLRAQVLKAQ